MRRGQPWVLIAICWALSMSACDVKAMTGNGIASLGAQVDIKLRPGVSLDDPLGFLPSDLLASVRSVVPLTTLAKPELERIGAARMARWFRLELTPGTDADTFISELVTFDAVETAERAPEPAPDPGG